MTKRVFVSSTLTDLVEYRKRVQNVIRQLGAIDISMEHFGSRDERPKDECLRIVQEESDLFVGIYAHRYGSIPKGDTKSITELEYETATLSKIPKFIYIVDDNVAWKLAYIDSGRSAGKLKNFKERLKANHLCKFFSSEDQLASFVAADLGRYLSEKNTNQSLELPEGIDSKFQVSHDDLHNTFTVHDGRKISVENLALIRKLSLRIFEANVTDDEIVEWLYLLPQTASPFEKAFDEKSKIYVNDKPLQSPKPLNIYNAVNRYKAKRNTKEDDLTIKSFIEIIRSVQINKNVVIIGKLEEKTFYFIRPK